MTDAHPRKAGAPMMSGRNGHVTLANHPKNAGCAENRCFPMTDTQQPAPGPVTTWLDDHHDDEGEPSVCDKGDACHCDDYTFARETDATLADMESTIASAKRELNRQADLIASLQREQDEYTKQVEGANEFLNRQVVAAEQRITELEEALEKSARRVHDLSNRHRGVFEVCAYEYCDNAKAALAPSPAATQEQQSAP